jgi:[acyl-carrier-protein] S-malonyltransferase
MSLAAVFPGQGSQYQGMGLDFIENDREWFESIEQKLSFPLRELIEEGPAEKPARTKYTQPVIFTVSHLIYRYMCRNGFDPDYFAGHSLGEYNALVAAGWVSFEDLLPAVVARGQAMDEVAEGLDGGMAAVLKLEPEPLKELCEKISADDSVEGKVEVALLNSPGQSVVSGSKAGIEAVVEKARDAGALKAVALDVSGPWHSSYMEPARQKLKDILAGIDWKEGKPYFANATGEMVDSETPEKHLLEQMVNPVLWSDSVQNMLEAGVNKFVEVGPGKVLSGLIKRISRKSDIKPEIFKTDKLEQTDNCLKEVQ